MMSRITTTQDIMKEFREWLNQEERRAPRARFFFLKDCNEVMPPDSCNHLGVPLATTYGDAIKTIMEAWEHGVTVAREQAAWNEAVDDLADAFNRLRALSPNIEYADLAVDVVTGATLRAEVRDNRLIVEVPAAA
jgi:hypothetical protein